MRGKVFAVLAAISMVILLLVTWTNQATVQAEVPGFEYNLTNDTLAQRDPAIWGDRMVWNERISGIWHIILYDLSMDTDGDGTPNYQEDVKPNPDPARIQITHNDTNKYNPDIHGEIVVWEDTRHGNSDIYMYDLTEDTDGDKVPNYLDDDDDDDGTLDSADTDPDLAEVRITDNPSYQEEPAIYGSKIVWTDLRFGNRDIFIYDMLSGREILIAGFKEEGILVPSPDPSKPDKIKFPLQRNPSIYRDKVAWEDNRVGNYEIFIYNLSMDSDSDGLPNYQDADRPSPDPAEIQITNNTQSDFEPSVFENYITYARSDNIYLYDIQSGTEFQITDSTSGQKVEYGICNIYGTKIVFSYGSDDEYYVNLYDLSTDTNGDGIPNYRDPQRPSPDPALNNITDVPLTLALPVIYNNMITWEDDRNASNSSYDIYIFTMTENLPPDITYSAPEHKTNIEENQSQIFNITASDPDGDSLEYSWFVDGQHKSGEIIDTFNFTTNYDFAGLHEVIVVVSDGEYFVDKGWFIDVTESGVNVLEITDYEPKFDPVLNETEEITFSIEYSYLGSREPVVHWQVQENLEPELAIDVNGLSTVLEALFDINGSDITEIVTVTTWITDGVHNVSLTWNLTVNYYDDVDGDNYSDATEVTWSSDPLLVDSTPPDLDGDFIVDGEDDDIDGDGYSNEDDDYPLDPDRHTREENGNLILIIGIVVIIVIILVVLLTLPRMRKQ